MVPLKDENPVQITPVVTYTLIVINLVVFLGEFLLSSGQLSQFMHEFAFVPQEFSQSLRGIATDSVFPEPLTLVTAQFLHGSILHVGFNMLYLWIFGNNIEEELGRFNFTIFYIVCGILASLVQWFFESTSTVPTLGASGAIAGVMGAYIFRFPQVRIITLIPLGFFFFTVRVPALFFLGFWFVQQAFNGIASFEVQVHVGSMQNMVAYWAHAGGFVFGALLAPLLGLFSSQNSTDSVDPEQLNE
ncbi:rhomboid family intramembrane serine protease [Geitlerinema sp. CS-897]|uniref:rhomboid family intramembrane serine protease n=1 Tax=Baaleninema simplex TaxID=2862350 RepID=UPI00034AAC4F|nr:rhomboid family intramembrane serine protease [Baaleninema simplex]MDC0833922.1 rhomboid family intramembrane serine protease [Geitlerinema sp. CS-897]